MPGESFAVRASELLLDLGEKGVYSSYTLHTAGLIGAWEQPVSSDQAWPDVPVTAVDRLNADYQLLRLKSDWPFMREPVEPRIPRLTTPVEEIAYAYSQGAHGWTEAIRRLLWRAARAQVAAGDRQGARDNLQQLLVPAPDHSRGRQLLDSLNAGP